MRQEINMKEEGQIETNSGMVYIDKTKYACHYTK